MSADRPRLQHKALNLDGSQYVASGRRRGARRVPRGS